MARAKCEFIVPFGELEKNPRLYAALGFISILFLNKRVPGVKTPQYTRVPKGSCIIFMNWVSLGEIMINFKEGKTCQDVTQAPMGFKLDPKFGCYVTDYVRRGETTSLMFIEAWSHACSNVKIFSNTNYFQ